MKQKSGGKHSACPHVNMVMLSWEEIKNKTPKCLDCDKVCAKGAWLCLFQYCEYIGCGAKMKDHSTKHQEQEGHPLCINLQTKRFWCRDCQHEVFEFHNQPAFALRKFAAGFEANARSGTAAGTAGSGGRSASQAAAAAPALAPAKNAAPESSSEPEDQEEEEEDPEPETLGLSGLRNLGNTCYMNAALQALSNCRQLTGFFFDCPGLTRPGRYASRTLPIPLSNAYAGLLADLWSPRRPQVVSPHLLLQSMRQAHPAFRGYTQQDSQEFLRCFMDQLHEELKRPVLLPPVLGEEEAFGGEGGGDVGGGGVGAASSEAESAAAAASGASPGAAISSGAASSASLAAASSVGSAGSGVGSAEDAGLAGSGGVACGDASAAATACGDSRLGGAGGKSGNRRVCFKSIISDTFNGSLVSTVQCNTCERLSSTREVFQDLSLPIPSGEHLTTVQKKSVIGQSGYGYQTWWLTSLLTWPLSWMRGLFAGPRVTLQDCLAAFFSNDDLKGDNMYHCEKCGKLRNGVKYSRISRLPEMLTIHLKRFRHDYLFSMKIGAPVAFPIEGLDMKPYLHRDCRARQTVYDLTAVVCHYGSTLGGHYTAYALNHAGMQWYEFDDSRVRKVDVSAVDSCQAYVLFYRKRDEWMQPLRMRVKEVMETPQDSSSLMPFYISRPWLNKFNTFGDPGPISNEDFLCPHQLLSPHIPDCAETMVIRLPYAAWDFLMGQFGGGPTVNRLGPCPECTAELERSRGRAAAELETVEREMENFKRSSGSVYLISMRWFRRWEGFVYQRNLQPPGHIDNSAIVVRRGKGLAVRPNSDYAQVSGRIWRYLLSIYGGGPEVRLGSAKQSSSSSSSDTSSSNSRRSSVSSGGGGGGSGVGGRGDSDGKVQAEANSSAIPTVSATPRATVKLDDADKD